VTKARSRSTVTGAQIAGIIAAGYVAHAARFAKINERAPDRFALREWGALHDDAVELIDMYAEDVRSVLSHIQDLTGVGDLTDEVTVDRALWVAARGEHAAMMASRRDGETADTFFNSITRKVFDTVGIDPEIEFASIRGGAYPAAPVRRFSGSAEQVVTTALDTSGIPGRWRNLVRDARLAAGEIESAVKNRGQSAPIDSAEILDVVFFRGQGAYLVGRVIAGGDSFPVAFCTHHTSRGLVLGAALTEVGDINVLFSYTRSAFHLSAKVPGAVVDYLAGLMPAKRRAELYSTIGYRKHAKTELYGDLMAHVATTGDRFEHARGIKGMVMVVFTLSGYDVVFKVIRDRFPYPKQTTRRRVMAKYRLVFRHDRAGRLIDAQEFEQLRFDRRRFTDALIAELGAEAARTVTIDESSVTLHHVYVERRVIPLDIYVREANPVKARSAIVDYGRAIKDLAATNIFPGDMLLKNFGVTRAGRVVFYDYDEITELTRCRFREMPETQNVDDEMSATPWFGVGDDDVFPEEFTSFLGLRHELREAFDYHHSDLFGVRFWQRAQERVHSGETIEVFPYRRARRLGAGRQHRLAEV